MNGNNQPRRRLRARSARIGRRPARPRLARTFAFLSTAALVAGGAMVAVAGPAAATDTETVHVKQSTITGNDNGCEASTWSGVHFVMTQLGTGYPASITVTLTDGTTDTTVSAPRWKTTGKTTHYNYYFTPGTQNLHVKDATATVPNGWKGQFNISNCWPGDDSQTSTVTLSKLWVNGTAGDKVTLTISGDDVSNPQSGTSTAPIHNPGTSASATVTTGSQITLTEAFQDEHSTYTTILQCKVDDGTYQDVTSLDGLSGTYTVPSDAESVDCRFTNTGESQETPSTTVTLAKKWVDGADLDSVNLVVKNTTTGASDGTGESTFGGSSSISSVTAYADDTINILEGANAGTDLADYTTTWACTTDNEPLYIGDKKVEGTGTFGSFTLPQDIANLPAIACTFTNTHKTTVTVEKKWVVNDDDPVADTADDGMTPGTLTVADVQGAEWGIPFEWTGQGWPTVTEGDGAGFDSDACSQSERETNPTVGHPKSLATGGNNVITVTNYVSCQRGRIELVKIWEGASGSPSTTLTINGGTTDETKAVSTWDRELGSDPDRHNDAYFRGLVGEPVTIAETPVAGYAATWACYEPRVALRNVAAGAFVAEVPDYYGAPVKQGAGTSATFEMPDGYWSCVFTNTKRPNPPPPPPPTPTSVTPAYTYQCLLVDGASQVTVKPDEKAGLTYDVTGNGTDTVTIVASAPSSNFTVNVPDGWTDEPGDSAGIVLDAADLTCIGGEEESVTPPADVEVVTPPIAVLGESQELPPPAVQAAPSANAHTGQGESPWGYVLLGAGVLLLLGAVRVRRHGRA